MQVLETLYLLWGIHSLKIDISIGQMMITTSTSQTTKFTLLTPSDSALASVTLPMKEAEPEVVAEGDEEFMDEDDLNKESDDNSGADGTTEAESKD